MQECCLFTKQSRHRNPVCSYWLIIKQQPINVKMWNKWHAGDLSVILQYKDTICLWPNLYQHACTLNRLMAWRKAVQRWFIKQLCTQTFLRLLQTRSLRVNICSISYGPCLPAYFTHSSISSSALLFSCQQRSCRLLQAVLSAVTSRKSSFYPWVGPDLFSGNRFHPAAVWDVMLEMSCTVTVKELRNGKRKWKTAVMTNIQHIYDLGQIWKHLMFPFCGTLFLFKWKWSQPTLHSKICTFNMLLFFFRSSVLLFGRASSVITAEN